MKKPLKIAFALLAAAAFALPTKAQIVYTGGKLNIGDVTTPRDGFINVAGPTSAVFRHDNTFIRYDVGQSIPYISGSNGYVGICCTSYGPMFMNFTCSSVLEAYEPGLSPYGSSRQNGGTLDALAKYSGAFYEELLGSNSNYKSLGSIVAYAKQTAYKRSSGESSRWLQFSLNPLGDPEMPIFISEPINFDNVYLNSIGNTLEIDTGEDHCRVSIIRFHTDGTPEIHSVFENIRHVKTNSFPIESSICITKQGYIPYVATIKCVQNEVLTGTNDIRANLILMGSMVNDSKSYGDVLFTNGFAKTQAEKTIIAPNTTIGDDVTFVINF